MQVNLNFEFSSPKCEEAFNCSKRNLCLNGGYGSGKTYVLCQKAIALLAKFPNYRIAIGRYSSIELRRTTMQTFFKVCPPEFYDEKLGGHRVDSLGYVDFINGSRVYWMHFDQYDEGALRSLEINSAIIDQAEELPESVYLTLDSRVGRWDKAIVPQDLLQAFPNWPRNKMTGDPMAPAYMMVACNPPDEGEFHWIWQRYHPESPEHQEKYVKTHAYWEVASFENKALPSENLETMLTRDPEWVKRFVHGKFSRGEGAIHEIHPSSILDPEPDSTSPYKISPDLLKEIIQRGALSRFLDHGVTAPTSCLWVSAYKGMYFVFREYYVPNKPISYHRRSIAELSGDEYYSMNMADPAIFKKSLEKYGGFWTVADEYRDSNLSGPSLNWLPGDNNEFATRNRINELLSINPALEHPITKEKGAPLVYFIKKTSSYASGCFHVIKEISSQKKKLLDTINGRPIYGDDREDCITDHAYDGFRYFAATHLGFKSDPKPKYKPNSFEATRRRISALKKAEYFDRYGLPTR